MNVPVSGCSGESKEVIGHEAEQNLMATGDGFMNKYRRLTRNDLLGFVIK